METPEIPRGATHHDIPGNEKPEKAFGGVLPILRHRTQHTARSKVLRQGRPVKDLGGFHATPMIRRRHKHYGGPG